MAKAFVVAATASGSGKTMLTLGLLRAFRNLGLKVASAKVGPDHIDPRFHEAASGRPCLNLDPWAMKREVVASLLSGINHDADLIIVEGVMGLFDGPAGSKGLHRRSRRRIWGFPSSWSLTPATRANPSPPLQKVSLTIAKA